MVFYAFSGLVYESKVKAEGGRRDARHEVVAAGRSAYMASMVERGGSGWIGHSARIEPSGGDGPPGRGGKLSDQVRRGGLYRMAGPGASKTVRRGNPR